MNTHNSVGVHMGLGVVGVDVGVGGVNSHLNPKPGVVGADVRIGGVNSHVLTHVNGHPLTHLNQHPMNTQLTPKEHALTHLNEHVTLFLIKKTHTLFFTTGGSRPRRCFSAPQVDFKIKHMCPIL